MKMKTNLKRRHFFSELLTFAVLFTVASALFVTGSFAVRRTAEPKADDIAANPRPVIVLDPGHGGEDGGASGKAGTLEKDLNLSITKAVATLLQSAGYDVRLTREEDTLLYDRYGDLTDYTGHKKTYDLRNRLRFAKETGAALLVSIHMNTFPDGRYSGLQVYYSPAREESRTVASLIQTYVRRYLQPENEREIKKANSSIYLLSRSESPAVLIECGFLSNEKELSLLTNPTYQKELALTLAAAIGEAVTGITP